MKTYSTLCIKYSIIVDCTSSVEYYFLCCSGVLVIAEVVSRFKTIDSFVRKLCKRGFELENKSKHRPVLNSTKFHGNVDIIFREHCAAWLRILCPMENCGPWTSQTFCD